MKRLHIGFPLGLYKSLQKLSEKWGLDVANTIRHCVALIIEKELAGEEKPGKSHH